MACDAKRMREWHAAVIHHVCALCRNAWTHQTFSLAFILFYQSCLAKNLRKISIERLVRHAMKIQLYKKGKGRLPSVGFRSWSGFLAVSLKVTSHKPGARLPLLSARPAVTLRTLKRVATNFAAWWTEARWAWTVCLRLLPDNALKLFVFRVSVFYTNGCRYQASFWQREREVMHKLPYSIQCL